MSPSGDDVAAASPAKRVRVRGARQAASALRPAAPTSAPAPVRSVDASFTARPSLPFGLQLMESSVLVASYARRWNQAALPLFQQRLLQALHSEAQAKSAEAVAYFYRNFPAYRRANIVRAQFLSRDLLLLKLGLSRRSDHGSLAAVFSVSDYAFRAVADWNKVGLVQLWRRFAGLDVPEAARMHAQMLPHLLPQPPQMMIDSPFLDPAVFIYDIPMMSGLRRPRNVPNYAMRFVSRTTGRLVYTFAFEADERAALLDARSARYMQLPLWHPSLPFVICVRIGESVVQAQAVVHMCA